jgi:hypothetical protein
MALEPASTQDAGDSLMWRDDPIDDGPMCPATLNRNGKWLLPE